MLSGNARRYMLDAPWMALWPCVLGPRRYGMNMLGDGLRDVLDPRLRADWTLREQQGKEETEDCLLEPDRVPL